VAGTLRRDIGGIGMVSRLLLNGAGVAMGMYLVPPAIAQEQRDAQGSAEPAHDDELAYPASFYATFGVQTAFDIIARTPGFIVSEGDDVRGFGGAAGNVLIDGQRPTVKTGGIADVLRRIPAARVDRVVLIRGGGLAAEAQGQTLVANVVLVAEDEEAGNITLTLARQRNGWIAPSAEISYGTGIGKWEVNGTASADIDREDVRGLYRILDDDRQLLQSWIEQAPSRSIETALSGSVSGPLAGGTLTVNARRSEDWFRDRIRLDVHAGPPTGPLLTQRSLDFDENYREIEVGADWSGQIWPDWTGKLVLLARPNYDRVDQGGANESGLTLSSLGQRAFEGVARSTLSRKAGSGLAPEIGVEVAQNRLHSVLDYAEEVDGTLIDVPLPGSDLKVTELRGEGFINLTLPVVRSVHGDLGLAAEWSRIRVVGDISNQRQFVYVKPSAALIWNISKRSQIRVGVRRTVDQLDFGDFAASVQSVEDRPISGNATLRPARITRASIKLDHRWGKTGAIAIDAYHERRDGVLDYVSTVSGGQAIGVAGNGSLWGLNIQGTLPLDRLLAGARLTADVTLRHSRLRDPLSGRPRALSGLPAREATFGFRHDWQRLKSSWGIDLIAPKTTPTFYVDEIERVRTSERLAIYAETSLVKGVRITLRARAVTGEDVSRRRDFFDRPGSGAYLGSQIRNRDRGARIVLGIVRGL